MEVNADGQEKPKECFYCKSKKIKARMTDDKFWYIECDDCGRKAWY